MTPLRILLADDDAGIRSFVEAALKTRNYLVHPANDGAEALDVLKTLGNKVDLLITDVRMPGMNGVDLARAVAEIDPTIPVLFISGWSDLLDAPEWLGPRYAFLRKPFLPKVLTNSIEELLARSAAKTACHSLTARPGECPRRKAIPIRRSPFNCLPRNTDKVHGFLGGHAGAFPGCGVAATPARAVSEIK